MKINAEKMWKHTKWVRIALKAQWGESAESKFVPKNAKISKHVIKCSHISSLKNKSHVSMPVNEDLDKKLCYLNITICRFLVILYKLVWTKSFFKGYK